ncbi:MULTISPECIES: LysR family transcriptional regulator [Roseobacteraceae]|uniref:LysR family transcriptional regulator n=1 Tax=Roseobacteraceae TaxID=2854170 RepID=UPI0008EB9262|nr:LysR family transcriptional regulator [Salipiger profundus]SFD80382.1 transcriptional regulator, LysR family [Salipiger profundus]
MHGVSVASYESNLPKAIELRHLRYFVCAAELGSFRKAAAALSVQESSISRQIRDLEDEIGVSLFQRHSAGVALTNAGARFLPAARRALRTIFEGARDIEGSSRGDEGVVKIGIFSSLASGYLSELFRAFNRKHSHVRMEFIDGSPRDHVSAVRQLDMDIAFITAGKMWLDCETAFLWSEQLFVVIPNDHPLSNKDQVNWNDLAASSFIVGNAASGQEIHDFIVKRLAELGYHPEVDPQYVGRDNLLPLVAIGRGLTLTSEATTAAKFPGVAYRPISGEVLPFCAVWSPRNDNPALRRLLSLARTMSKSTL